MSNLQKFLDAMPHEPTVLYNTGKRDVRYWSDGTEILCDSDYCAEIIANLIEHVFKIDCHLGFYDPDEDERNGEVDERTGYFYVDFFD